MHYKQPIANEKGVMLIGTLLVLVAVTAIGLTLMNISTFERDMAGSEACKEEARYNSESSSISGAKLIKLVSAEASAQGVLGIPEGDDRIPGITYGEAEGSDPKEVEFARKVLGDLEDQVCEDFTLTPQGANMDASGNLRSLGAQAVAGSAANRQISGYSYGIGLGGAAGGGHANWFILASRGRNSNQNCRHISYVRYRKLPPSVGGGF
jgi:hypothetical protein